MILYYRMDDGGVHGVNGLIPIEPRDSFKWNSEKWGIFWTVNQFNQSNRMEHFESIKSWYVDIDLESESEKEDALAHLIEAPLKPSMINETSRGYHAYWLAEEGTEEGYRAVQDALSNYFNGDGLKNLNRILRVPNHYHWKNPENPFMISTVFIDRQKYTEQEMIAAFPLKKKSVVVREIKEIKEDSIWNKLSNVNCREALEKLSGSKAVKGEVYSFRENFNGTVQILVDDKTTGAWLDEEGFIGSYAGGGPTILQWLKYYGHDWGTIATIGERLLL